MKILLSIVMATGLLLPNMATAQEHRKGEQLRQEVRVVTIGSRKTAKFRYTTEKSVLKLEGPDGEIIEEPIPAGYPIEIRGKKDEYAPHRVYVKNRGTENGFSFFNLGLNTFSSKVKLSPRDQIKLYRRQITESEEGVSKPKLKSYASIGGSQKSTHLLVAMIRNHRLKESWANPKLKIFDTSPAYFGSDACLAFNASPFPMIITFGGMEKILLAPLQHKYIRGLKKDKYGAVPYTIFLKVGNKVERLPRSGLRAKANSRHYIFCFADTRKGATRRGDLIVRSEEVPKKFVAEDVGLAQ